MWKDLADFGSLSKLQEQILLLAGYSKFLTMIHQIKALQPLRDGSSFYKASREDGLYSAVKVFPFAFSATQNKEMEERTALVRLAIDEYRAGISKVVDWGLTGSFSYIEFDWIVGMSMAEKFNIERNALLTIQEILVVAEQVSRTLTLCHKIGLQHGSVCLKEIIWAADRSRYVLTGFFSGIKEEKKVLSPITAKESLNNSGDLQKKDIKDLGFVLIQLLTGNAIITEFDEKQLNLAREMAIPPQWTMEKFEDEKSIPSWFCQLLADAISGNQFSHMGDFYFALIKNNKQPIVDKKYRSKPYVQAPLPLVKKLPRVSELYNYTAPPFSKKKVRRHFVFDGKMAAGFLIAGMLFGFSLYSQKKQIGEKQVASVNETANEPLTPLVRELEPEMKPVETPKPEPKKETKLPSPEPVTISEKKPVADTTIESPAAADSSETKLEQALPASEGLAFYMVKSKAYFHNEPDESTRRKGFIIHWNNAILIPVKEENDFVYVVFTNKEGQTSRGWLKKSDLIAVEEK